MNLRRIRERICREGFLRNVLILTGGTVFAQGLAALALPLLTRLYTPSDFSLLAVYVSVVTIITVISCLRYNLAISLPDDDRTAFSLLILSILSSLIVSSALALAVFVFPSVVVNSLGQPALISYLWMIPVGVLFASFYNALQYWSARKKRFVEISKTRVSRALGGVGAQLGAVGIVSGPFGLLFGHMLYSGLGVLKLSRSILSNDRESLGGLRYDEVKRSARSYKNFPLFSVPEALFNTAGSHVPVLIIAATAVNAEAGYLMLAMKVMGLPMGLIGSSVAQVYLAEAPARMRSGELTAFTRLTMFSLLKTGGPPLVLLGAAAPFLFGPVFGDQWSMAGSVVAWLTPLFILQFIASPVSVVLHVTGKVLDAMWLQFFGLVLRVGGAWIAAEYFIGHQIEFYAVSGALFYLVYIAVVFIVVRKFEKSAVDKALD